MKQILLADALHGVVPSLWNIFRLARHFIKYGKTYAPVVYLLHERIPKLIWS
jgi:hypothetical protein